MPRDVPGCSLCGSPGQDPFTVQRNYAWYRCRGCGYVYLSPQPSPEDLAAAYETYLPHDEAGIERWGWLMRDIFAQAAELLEREVGGVGSLLDVGCAYGFFLQAMGNRGWRVRGIDLSQRAVAKARSAGLQAEVVSVEQAEFDAGSFDAVTLFYVLEHVRDPVAVLERVWRWLKPGGAVLLRVPHTAPIVRLLERAGIPNALLDPPFHLCDISPQLMSRLLHRVGFARVRTLPGAATRPVGGLPFLTTKVFSVLARSLYAASGCRLLLPGVSKTTLAVKPVP